MKTTDTVSKIFRKRIVKYESESELYAVPIGMGIEVEVERVPQIEITDEFNMYWEIKRDNSLRNDGREFVLRSPLCGQQLIGSINSIAKVFEENPPSLSHRCSLHTHIDFRERTFEEVWAFVYLYVLLESVLYTISEKERYSNIYCPGMTNTTGLPALLGMYIGSKKENEITTIWSKYTGLNLSPLQSFGSIEIRTHRGTLSRDEILSWTRILNYMYSFIMGKTHKDIEKFCLGTPKQLMDAIFTKEMNASISHENLNRYWVSAIRNIFHINVVSHAIREHVNKPKPEIKILEAL